MIRPWIKVMLGGSTRYLPAVSEQDSRRVAPTAEFEMFRMGLELGARLRGQEAPRLRPSSPIREEDEEWWGKWEPTIPPTPQASGVASSAAPASSVEQAAVLPAPTSVPVKAEESSSEEETWGHWAPTEPGIAAAVPASGGEHLEGIHDADWSA